MCLETLSHQSTQAVVDPRLTARLATVFSVGIDITTLEGLTPFTFNPDAIIEEEYDRMAAKAKQRMLDTSYQATSCSGDTYTEESLPMDPSQRFL